MWLQSGKVEGKKIEDDKGRQFCRMDKQMFTQMGREHYSNGRKQNIVSCCDSLCKAPYDDDSAPACKYIRTKMVTVFSFTSISR